jgi:hypothetical protein
VRAGHASARLFWHDKANDPLRQRARSLPASLPDRDREAGAIDARPGMSRWNERSALPPVLGGFRIGMPRER